MVDISHAMWPLVIGLDLTSKLTILSSSHSLPGALFFTWLNGTTSRDTQVTSVTPNQMYLPQIILYLTTDLSLRPLDIQLT